MPKTYIQPTEKKILRLKLIKKKVNTSKTYKEQKRNNTNKQYFFFLIFFFTNFTIKHCFRIEQIFVTYILHVFFLISIVFKGKGGGANRLCDVDVPPVLKLFIFSKDSRYVWYYVL